MAVNRETSPKSNPIDPKEGAMLGEFRLVRRLGMGGMAEVWLAEQTSLKRRVAIKMLRPDALTDETVVKRFELEAKAVAALNHPNIVQIYTIGKHEGTQFIVQEYIDGSSLREHLRKRGPLDLVRAVHVMRQVAAALQAAGDRNIVHRDIKPENIMISKKGEVKVADFGLAQLSEGGEKLHLTSEGMTLGTPHYMSPEQVQGEKLDPRSDIYSFGVTSYHMLSGQTPFKGDTAVSVAVQHLNIEPPDLKTLRGDLPEALCVIVKRMMAKALPDRYPNALTLSNDLRALAKSLKDGEVPAVPKSKPKADSKKKAKGATKKVAASVDPNAPLRWYQRQKLAFSLVTILVTAASAGLGFALHPGDPALIPALVPLPSKAENAERQFLNGMLLVDSEDAFQAVIVNFPEDKMWVRRAKEQLALYYLARKDRWGDAERVLQDMAIADDHRHVAKAHVGQASLALARQNLELAKSMLAKYAAEYEQQLPEGSTWYRMWKQTQEGVPK